MSQNPAKNDKMYISTPLKNKAHSGKHVCDEFPVGMSPIKKDKAETGCNAQKYYSLPENSTFVSENTESDFNKYNYDTRSNSQKHCSNSVRLVRTEQISQPDTCKHHSEREHSPQYYSLPINSTCLSEKTIQPDANKYCGTGYNQKFHSLLMESVNSTGVSEQVTQPDTTKYHSLPFFTANTMSSRDQSNERESCSTAPYRTPADVSLNRNSYYPTYFERPKFNQSRSSERNPNQGSEYMNKPNVSNQNASCSHNYTDDSSTICSQNKTKILQKYSDINPKELNSYRQQLKQGTDTDTDSNRFCSMLMMNSVNPQSRNKQWDPSSENTEFKNSYIIGKSILPWETYPNKEQYLKKNNRCSVNIGPIKEEECQLPPFRRNSDSSNSTTNSCSACSFTEDLAAKCDSINMLSVVISTVMLLASKSQIPQNYITWTLKYLKCIKNNQGQYPPNIKKIQKMLSSSTTENDQSNCMGGLPGKNPCK